MEDLFGYKVLRSELLEGRYEPGTVELIARHLAAIHTQTHVATIGEAKMAVMVAEFRWVVVEDYACSLLLSNFVWFCTSV